MEYSTWNSVYFICNVLFEFLDCCQSSSKNSELLNNSTRTHQVVWEPVTMTTKVAGKWICHQKMLVRKTSPPLTCALGRHLAANHITSQLINCDRAHKNQEPIQNLNFLLPTKNYCLAFPLSPLQISEQINQISEHKLRSQCT